MKNRYVIHRYEKGIFAIIDRGQLGSPVVFESPRRAEVEEQLERLSSVESQPRATRRLASRAEAPIARCCATTVNGSRCRNAVDSEGATCWVHARESANELDNVDARHNLTVLTVIEMRSDTEQLTAHGERVRE